MLHHSKIMSNALKNKHKKNCGEEREKNERSNERTKAQSNSPA